MVTVGAPLHCPLLSIHFALTVPPQLASPGAADREQQHSTAPSHLAEGTELAALLCTPFCSYRGVAAV